MRDARFAKRARALQHLVPGQARELLPLEPICTEFAETSVGVAIRCVDTFQDLYEQHCGLWRTVMTYAKAPLLKSVDGLISANPLRNLATRIVICQHIIAYFCRHAIAPTLPPAQSTSSLE